jgi:hypothetical protein
LGKAECLVGYGVNARAVFFSLRLASGGETDFGVFITALVPTARIFPHRHATVAPAFRGTVAPHSGQIRGTSSCFDIHLIVPGKNRIATPAILVRQN